MATQPPEPPKETPNKAMNFIKNTFSEENMHMVKEKYLKPAYRTAKEIALKIWALILEYTPKVIAAIKEISLKTYAQGKALYQKYAEKKTPPPSQSSGPRPPSTGPTPPTT